VSIRMVWRREFKFLCYRQRKISPLVNAAAAVIPDHLRGTTLDCALMETVFHDVSFAAGPKNWSKATHVAGTCTRGWLSAAISL